MSRTAAEKDEKSKTDHSLYGIMILSAPRGVDADQARENKIEGKVAPKITFKNNGKIGQIKANKGSPYGWNEKSSEDAGKIRFEPQIKNKKPVTVTKNNEYNFIIY